MCLILCAYQHHPKYPLVIAANRDEFYERPTAPAKYWEDYPDILAGRDLEQMGTWLGIDRKGRYAAVTNYRDPRLKKEGVYSRGRLVADYLCGKKEPYEYLTDVSKAGNEYNGYNLLAGDSNSLYYYSNIEGALKKVSPGVHGLSNHLLNTPWLKVEKGKQALKRYLASDRAGDPFELLTIMSDDTEAEEHLLPCTGVSLEWERLLSSIFIRGESYGTRSTTVIFVDYRNHVQYIERSFLLDSGKWQEAAYEFDIT